MLDNKKPSVAYKLIDCLGNNHLWGFIYSKYIGQLNIFGNARVLDFGSGSGAGSKYLAMELPNGHLTCVDVSEYWMNVCRRRLSKYNNVDFLLGWLPDFKIEANSYDIVNIHYVLHEVPKQMRITAIDEMYRMLKRGGRICIKEPQRKDDGMAVSEIRELMQESGFSEITVKEAKGIFQAEYIKQPN